MSQLSAGAIVLSSAPVAFDSTNKFFVGNLCHTAALNLPISVQHLFI